MIIHPKYATSLNTEITAMIIEIEEKCIPNTTGTKSCRRSTPCWDDECARVDENRRRANNLVYKYPSPEKLLI